MHICKGITHLYCTRRKGMQRRKTELSVSKTVNVSHYIQAILNIWDGQQLTCILVD